MDTFHIQGVNGSPSFSHSGIAPYSVNGFWGYSMVMAIKCLVLLPAPEAGIHKLERVAVVANCAMRSV